MATVLICWQVGLPMVRLASDPENFRQWLEEKTGRSADLWCYGVFPGPVCVHSREPLEIAGGYAFGAVWGTLVCLVAATLGSLLVFGLVRRFGTRLVEVFFPAEKLRAVRFLQSSPKRTILFLVIFMIPGTPKDLLCYFAGLTDIKFPVFLLVCSLGRLPSVVTSTVGGDALGNPGLSICRRSFSGYLPDQRGRPVVLPSDL
ncbi:MAG: TVP38/TMEM64 family protein [Evtepia gabavorous]